MTDRRTVMQYHFEGEAAVYVEVVGTVHPRAVIWALRELISLKDRELVTRFLDADCQEQPNG